MVTCFSDIVFFMNSSASPYFHDFSVAFAWISLRSLMDTWLAWCSLLWWATLDILVALGAFSTAWVGLNFDNTAWLFINFQVTIRLFKMCQVYFKHSQVISSNLKTVFFQALSSILDGVWEKMVKPSQAISSRLKLFQATSSVIKQILDLTDVCGSAAQPPHIPIWWWPCTYTEVRPGCRILAATAIRSPCVSVATLDHGLMLRVLEKHSTSLQLASICAKVSFQASARSSWVSRRCVNW